MAFPDLTINEQYDLKAKYNEVTLAMEAATLTLNPQTMARVATALAAIPLPANSAMVDEFSQYDLLANLPPRSPLGVKVGLILNDPPGSTPIKGFSLGGTGAYIQKNAQIPVLNSAGATFGVNATVSVTNNVASDVKLPSTAAVITAPGTVTVKNSAGGGDTAIANFTITAGVLVDARLPAAKAIVTSATKVVVPVNGTFVNGFTPTVVNGVITGITLS